MHLNFAIAICGNQYYSFLIIIIKKHAHLIHLELMKAIISRKY
jgi:hypothetical protein